jgi:sRNA-binding protein
MRFVAKMFAVGVAGVVVTSTARHSYAQGARELGVKAAIYLGTVVVGTIWGTKAAEAQEKAAEARRRAEEEARAKAEREEAERRLRALERSAAEARTVEEAAKAKAEREAADRRFRELMKSFTTAPPPPPSPPPVTSVGKVYKLGTGSTSAQYCISFVAGVCSPCDYHADTCDVRFGERLIFSDAIK